MKLTPIEQETILNFNEGEDTASLYTYNQKLQKRFDQLAIEYPHLVSRTTNSFGAVTYDFPKKHLNLSFRKPLTEAEWQRRSEHGKKYGYKAKSRQ